MRYWYQDLFPRCYHCFCFIFLHKIVFAFVNFFERRLYLANSATSKTLGPTTTKTPKNKTSHKLKQQNNAYSHGLWHHLCHITSTLLAQNFSQRKVFTMIFSITSSTDIEINLKIKSFLANQIYQAVAIIIKADVSLTFSESSIRFTLSILSLIETPASSDQP